MQVPMFPPICLGYAYPFTAKILQLLSHPVVSYQACPDHCHGNYHKQSRSLLCDSENCHGS